MLGQTILKFRKAVIILNQIRKLQIIQLILETIFVILSYFWLLANLNLENGGSFDLALNLTYFYFILVFLILYIKIEIGFKYEDLKCLDKEIFPNLFITSYWVSNIFNLGIKLIPILIIVPSLIFYHEWVLRPLILYIALSSIFLPIPFILLRNFLEKDAYNKYRVGPLPLKSLNTILIVYSICRCFIFYIIYQIKFGSLSLSDSLFSIYYYIQVGLIIFALIIQFSMIDFVSRLKSLFNSALNK